METSDKINGPDQPEGPLDLSREGATKADLTATARWLEQRLDDTRKEIVTLREAVDANKNMVGDHLILIRRDLAGLQGDLAREKDEAHRAALARRRKRPVSRGRLRWLLVAFGLGLILGAQDWLRAIWGG